METEQSVEEPGKPVDDHAEPATRRRPPAVQKIVGFIVAAVLIFLAQRDLRKRPPELVRGPVMLWRAVAMVPPGAVGYLLLGRRRAASKTTAQAPNSIAA